ncbi:MAG: TolC family protein [Selenomonadaceae bacterium]|nr:TolC family protein [Selenomonadaceae bacterium]
MKKFFLMNFIAAMLIFNSTTSAMTLREAVDIALKNNPSLQQTQKAIDVAEEDVKIAKGQKGVSISLSGSADASKSEGTEESESVSSRVTGSLPLYTGKRLESAIKSAELYVDIAKFDFEQSKDDLIYQVVTAYVDALENKATNAVDIETRNNLAEHEQNISDLYEAGSKAKIDLLRATVETSNANQDVARSQAAYEVSLTNLATLMSINSISTFDVEDLNTSTDLIDIERCISAAEEQRNNLKADELRIERGEVQVTSAKSGWLPEVNASVGTGFSARSNKWDPTSDATAGVSASWSIFDSKVTRARVDEAKIEVERLKLSMQSDIDSVHKDVVTAHKNLRSALVRLETTKRAVDLAEEERFIATERYRAGEGILLDILDSEVALSTARKNHVSAKYDVIRYRFELAHAIGKTY